MFSIQGQMDLEICHEEWEGFWKFWNSVKLEVWRFPPKKFENVQEKGSLNWNNREICIMRAR